MVLGRKCSHIFYILNRICFGDQLKQLWRYCLLGANILTWIFVFLLLKEPKNVLFIRCYFYVRIPWLLRPQSTPSNIHVALWHSKTLHQDEKLKSGNCKWNSTHSPISSPTSHCPTTRPLLSEMRKVVKYFKIYILGSFKRPCFFNASGL